MPVLVAYNYSGPNHYELWTQGAVHVIVTEPFTVGRIHRVAGWALCTTPSAARHQEFHPRPDDRRYPTCKACIRTAARLTGVDTPTLLATHR